MQYTEKQIKLLQLAVVKLVIEKESLEAQLEQEKENSESYSKWWQEEKALREEFERALSKLNQIAKDNNERNFQDALTLCKTLYYSPNREVDFNTDEEIEKWARENYQKH